MGMRGIWGRVVVVVVVVEERVEDRVGEGREEGREVLFGGRGRGDGEGEEKYEAREGLVYVTFSGRVDKCKLVDWKEDGVGGVWEEDMISSY